jgi:hypothetical protein
VTAEFSWDHIAEKTERIYHQAVQDNCRRLGRLDCSGRHLKDARSVASSRVNAFVGGKRAAEELHKAA